MKVTQAEFIDKLKKKMATVDFKIVAPLIGATVKNDKIMINSLGKDFVFDRQGNMTSECHIIPWVQAPALSVLPPHQIQEVIDKAKHKMYI